MEKIPLADVHIDELLCRTVEAGCSELHLRVDAMPYMRFQEGYPLDELTEYEAVSAGQPQRMIYDILSDEQILDLRRNGVLLFSYSAAYIAEFDARIALSKDRMEADFHVASNRG